MSNERWKHGTVLASGERYHPSNIYDPEGNAVCAVYGLPLNCGFAGLDSPCYQTAMEHARLIAAAPLLWDALSAFMDMWNSGDSTKASARARQKRSDMWDLANEAMSALKGESE